MSLGIMRPDPLRVAGWCVVMLASIVFMIAVAQLTSVPPVIVTETVTVTTETRELPPPPPPPTTATQELYVGNASSRVLHTLRCRHAKCPNCTERFTDRQEAIDSGYRPGLCCNP